MKKTIISLILLVLLSISLYSQSSDPSMYYGVSQSEKINIFYDDFNNNSNEWIIGTSETSSGAIRNGYYYYQSLSATKSQTTNKKINYDHSRDFEIEAKIRYVRGKSTRGHALLWGIQSSPYEDYGFMFSESGSFEVTKYKNKEYIKLKDWTKLSNYKNGAFNKLTVRKVNNKYYFFFNEKLVFTSSYSNFSGKRIGFEIGKDAGIEIDYLRVSYISVSNTNEPTPIAEIPNAVEDDNNNSYTPVSYNGITKSLPIFIDEFDNNNKNWGVGETMNTNRRISGGTYYFESLKESFYSTTKTISINQQIDYQIETKIKIMSDGKAFENCLMWGMNDNKKSYRFGFTNNGFFTIYKMDSGVVDYLDYTKSSAIKKNSYNKLTVRKYGSKMYFFINETLVHTMNSQAFFGNKVGFLVGKKLSIKMDYLYIHELK